MNTVIWGNVGDGFSGVEKYLFFFFNIMLLAFLMAFTENHSPGIDLWVELYVHYVSRLRAASVLV